MSFPFVAVHHFPDQDPWHNLAREECLLDDAAPGAGLLLFYVNRPCVVLGKHQNPLREVRLSEAARRGIPIVRRPTGGGTVYHDEGNLNWSFLLPKDSYDRLKVTEAVAQALSPLGLVLTTGEKGDLFQGDKKVSGAAYLFRRDRVVHHGTLLCRARLDDLHGVLGPTGTFLDWVGVASRPMPVTNLGLDVGTAVAALATLAPGLPVETGRGTAAFEDRVRRRATELQTPAWLWDQTPPFTWEGQTSAGLLRVRVVAGRIEEAWDDRNQNMSRMVGKRFFDPEFLSIFPGRLYDER